MDQEKIGNFIKKIRKDNNLSQLAFAEKLGVSPQAVSKWENGKNLPDLSTLLEIKEQFNVNIDEIVAGDNFVKEVTENKKSKLFVIIILIIVIVFSILICYFINSNKKFEFNELNSTNTDFSITGSVVKTNDRTSIIINSVNYNGNDEDIVYEELSCTLYEENGEKLTKVTSCDGGSNLTLLEYLKDLKIRMDHHSPNCSMFTTSSMFIEISAIDKENKNIVYKIPIEISDESCD